MSEFIGPPFRRLSLAESELPPAKGKGIQFYLGHSVWMSLLVGFEQLGVEHKERSALSFFIFSFVSFVLWREWDTIKKKWHWTRVKTLERTVIDLEAKLAEKAAAAQGRDGMIDELRAQIALKAAKKDGLIIHSAIYGAKQRYLPADKLEDKIRDNKIDLPRVENHLIVSKDPIEMEPKELFVAYSIDDPYLRFAAIEEHGSLFIPSSGDSASGLIADPWLANEEVRKLRESTVVGNREVQRLTKGIETLQSSLSRESDRLKDATSQLAECQKQLNQSEHWERATKSVQATLGRSQLFWLGCEMPVHRNISVRIRYISLDDKELAQEIKQFFFASSNSPWNVTSGQILADDNDAPNLDFRVFVISNDDNLARSISSIFNGNRLIVESVMMVPFQAVNHSDINDIGHEDVLITIYPKIAGHSFVVNLTW